VNDGVLAGRSDVDARDRRDGVGDRDAIAGSIGASATACSRYPATAPIYRSGLARVGVTGWRIDVGTSTTTGS
jgi:hypothetical protein